MAAVLIPGLGREVNGSLRWIDLGVITIQASEPAKFAIIIYIGAYFVRHLEHVRTEFLGFIKPIGVLNISYNRLPNIQHTAEKCSYGFPPTEAKIFGPNTRIKLPDKRLKEHLLATKVTIGFIFRIFLRPVI